MLYSFVTTREITRVTAQKNTERWVRKSIRESNRKSATARELQSSYSPEKRHAFTARLESGHKCLKICRALAPEVSPFSAQCGFFRSRFSRRGASRHP